MKYIFWKKNVDCVFFERNQIRCHGEIRLWISRWNKNDDFFENPGLSKTWWRDQGDTFSTETFSIGGEFLIEILKEEIKPVVLYKKIRISWKIWK